MRERGPYRLAGDRRSSVGPLDGLLEDSDDGADNIAALAAIDGLTPGRVSEDGVIGEEPSADVHSLDPGRRESAERGEWNPDDGREDTGVRGGPSSVGVEMSLGARRVPVCVNSVPLAGENSEDLKEETSDAGDRGKNTEERERGVPESSVGVTSVKLAEDGGARLVAEGRGPRGLRLRTRRGPGGGLNTKDDPRPTEAPVLVPTGPP